MSFLKQYISNEGFALGLEDDTVTVDDEVQVAEAMGEANAVRQEIENTADDIEKADTVANELELQNDAMAGMAEENGGVIPEQAAAGFELARRAAVAAVGVDPDSEEGEEAVDAAGLESYSKGLISLEEAQEKNKGFLQKIKDSVIAAWKWIVEKVKAFLRWVGKITNILPKKFRESYNLIKDMEDKAFDEALDKYTSTDEGKEKAARLMANGKLVDIGDVTSDVSNFIDGCEMGFIDSVKFGYNAIRADKAYEQLDAEAYNEYSAKAAIIMMKHIKTKHGEEVTVNGTKYTIQARGGKFDIKEESVIKDVKAKFTRKELLDSLNQGIIAEKLFDRAVKSIEKIEKNKEADKLSASAESPLTGKYASIIFRQVSKTTSLSIKLFHELTAQRNNITSVAKAIAGKTGTEDKKETN